LNLKHITPLLIHQATDQIAQHNASVYSVQPYFLDGIISFHVQLSGSPEGFILNASTTLAAGSIGTDPEPNLVLVPKSMNSTVPTCESVTATIIAVTFETGGRIAYAVQVKNGTVVKLYGDKFVHDIDLIDRYAPPELSISTSRNMSEQKRDSPELDQGLSTSMQTESIAVVKRGIGCISSYTATFSEASCRSITCLSNGGKQATFNPFLKCCYCQSIIPDVASLGDKLESTPTDSNAASIVRRGLDSTVTPSGFHILKPSRHNCDFLIKCGHDGSTAAYDVISDQCYCEMVRKGVKEPVITSDIAMLPRSEETTNDLLDDSVSRNTEGLSFLPAMEPADLGDYCQTEFADKYCLTGMVGMLTEDRKACICIPLSSTDGGDTTGTVSEIMAKPTLGKRSDWYLRCTDNLLQCLNDPYHYRCNSDRKMIKHFRNAICEEQCECGSVNLAGCLNPRGGCSWSRPDHPGIGL
jgi:hypothetical protein